MPTPSLPVEVLDHIFSYLHPEQHGGPRQDGCIRQTWCNLSLVNHDFYSAAITKLYHTFDYDGSFESKKRPWKFLRTIVESPELANHVRAVDIQHMLRYTGLQSCRAVGGLVSENLEIVKRAVMHAGLSELGLDNIVNALREDISTPLAALIIACLPRLRTLYMHVPDDDPYMETLLSYAINVPSRWVSDNSRPQGPVLQQLEQLFIASNGRTQWNGHDFQIDKNRPFMFLPQLRQLTLIDAKLVPDVLRWSSPPYNATLSPHLTRLAIDLGDRSQLSELWRFLDSLSGITHLFLDFSGVSYSVLDSCSTAALWKCLARFQDTLEDLDISTGSRNTFNGVTGNFSPEHPPFCTPVWQFHKLKWLAIQPDILLGNCKDHTAPTQLVEHLPDGLEGLLLYGCPSEFDSLETMLEWIARVKSPPEKIYATGTGKRRAPELPTQQLERRCATRGIPFEVTTSYLVPHGRDWHRDFRSSSIREAIPRPSKNKVAMFGEIRATVPRLE